MASTEQPRRGEIWLVSLGAARRGEPGKNRPAIVASVDGLLGGADDELIVVVPLSSSRAPSKLRPLVSARRRASTPTAPRSPARSAPSARRRLLRRLGAVQPETMAEVERSLITILGLDRQPLAAYRAESAEIEAGFEAPAPEW